ncbi:hypothetical protein OF83DRAFT_1179458 [Amylostereum chailletii]|nr:hypothetical protein OF83DRAFT_1179458 [Amylostereum chailletii]
MAPRRGLGTLHIGQLLQMVLQDAQTRLFFKAQAVIQSEIRYYAPSADDLAYPDKLVVARRPATGYEVREKESVSVLFRTSGADTRETWYPTLSKTVWVLSQLHDFVQPAIFDDLAQEAINLCRQSLSAAAEQLAARNALDGALFLVRHLLILKDMTRTLALVVRSSAEPPPLAAPDTLAGMLARTTALLPSSLAESLGMARADDVADAKHGIDADLERACEAAIAALAAPLHAALAAPPAPPSSSSSTPDALAAAFRDACARDLRAGVARLRLYVEEERTADVLLAHVRARVGEACAGARAAAGGRGMGAEEVERVLRAACEEPGGRG